MRTAVELEDERNDFELALLTTSWNGFIDHMNILLFNKEQMFDQYRNGDISFNELILYFTQ